MKNSLTSALAASFLLLTTTDAIGGPLGLPHAHLTAEPQGLFEPAHFSRHRHARHYRHHGRHYHYHHHHALAPGVFSVAFEWRCNPLNDANCFYPGPYYRFPEFYQ